ncbi:M23 family metallopeptidase [Streptomyces sp. ICBB 8177]|uniref:murein hydrolase activator EnvC family protein n=1 Tax=Streptomyces sp. ICBB 8177 TaxID=563922 RepID=UPI000D67B139|nr:M23 family metallopeptidase [Streptomyces sp. ICBB 8177]PWI44315.1 peptidase M23 [Streptomyces sp. ICBB 8177]
MLGVLLLYVHVYAPGRAVADTAHGDDGARAWPVTGPHGEREPPPVLRGFDPPPAPWAPGHRGVDLGAPPGATVRSATSGAVTFAGVVAGQGVVTVQLSGSGEPPLRATYEPVRPAVRPGDRVSAGQSIGTLGPGPFHCPSGCLHWGLLRGDQYLDPLSLIPPALRRLGPSRLLPVHGVPPPAAAPVAAQASREPAAWAGGAGGWTVGTAAAVLAVLAWAGARFRSASGPPRAGPWRRRPR